MSYDLSQIPFSFSFPYARIWFLSPDGYVDGYMFDYYSFTLLNEVMFWLRIPFRTAFSTCC